MVGRTNDTVSIAPIVIVVQGMTAGTIAVFADFFFFIRAVVDVLEMFEIFGSKFVFFAHGETSLS